MPGYPVMQTGFNAGEWSPRMFGRFDLDRYPYAVKTMLNFLPRPQGPATRRSGTKYVANTYNDQQAVLIPFVRDATVAYVVEATVDRMRFYTQGGVLLAPTRTFEDGDVDVGNDEIDIDDHGYIDEQGPFRLTSSGTLPAGLALATSYYIVYVNADSFGLSLTAGGSKVTISAAAGGGTHTITPYGTVPYELIHSYSLAELQELDYAQSIDILFLAQQNNAPAELRREAADLWKLQDRTDMSLDEHFIDGPYLDLNRSSTKAKRDTTPDRITFDSVAGINGGAGLNSDDIGRHVWIRSDSDPTSLGWGYITSIVDTTHAEVTWVINAPTSLQLDWRMGAFYIGNYPGAVTFFEQRIAYGGTPDQPESLWASRTSDFDTFSPVTNSEEAGADAIGTVLADTALSFTLAISDDVQIVRWLKATRQLLCGVSGGIATVQASSLREPVTPTNINAFLSSSQGVKRARPILVEEAVAYLGANGKRLFQSEYVSASDTFRSEELSIRSEHVLAPGADLMAYAKDPDSVVWVRKTDGSLAAMTFIKTEEVLGWSRHELGGTFDGGDAVVESIAAIPTSDEDHTQLWLSVKRTVNGSTVRHIEYMEAYFTTQGGNDIRDAFMVDSGLSYDSPIDIEGATAADPVVVTVPSGHGLLDGDRIEIVDVEGMTDINAYFTVDNPQATTIDLRNEEDTADVDGTGFDAWERGGEIRVRVTSISGLDHLEGETVQVLADGSYRGEFTVASGSVTFGEPAAAIVHVGLGYVSDLVLLSPNYQAMQANSQGKLKRTAQVVLRLDESAGGLCGEEGGQLDAIIRRSVDDDLGHPVPLASDDIKTDVEMRWGRRTHLQIRQDLPMPLTVLAVMLDALQDQS